MAALLERPDALAELAANPELYLSPWRSAALGVAGQEHGRTSPVTSRCAASGCAKAIS